MKIWDAFLFNDELDLLELRFAELGEVVDEFVLVESTTTFSGKTKPLFFLENRLRFSKYLDRVTHIIVDDSPQARNPWVDEFFQRNAMSGALKSAAKNDVVLITDVDEIPRESVVRALAESLEVGSVASLAMRMSYYGFNWTFRRPFTLARAVRGSIATTLSAQEIRRLDEVDVRISDAGWHLSNFFPREDTVDRLLLKAQALSISEIKSGLYTDRQYLELCVRGGLPWSARPPYREKLTFITESEDFPQAFTPGVPGRWATYWVPQKDRDLSAEREAARRYVRARAGVALGPWETRLRRAGRRFRHQRGLP